MKEKMPEREQKRGYFIVLEGIDNCGKTTQAQLLKEYFERNGLPILLIREPGGTEVGEEIRQVLLKNRQQLMDPVTQTLLFYAARKEFLIQVVKPNLQEGISVITDRFETSTYVYQGFVQGVRRALLDSLHQEVVGGFFNVKPDLCFIFDITPLESMKRSHNEDKVGQQLIYEQQGRKFLEKLRRGYQEYARGRLKEAELVCPLSVRPCPQAVLINGMKGQQTVHREVVGWVEKLRRGENIALELLDLYK